MNGLQIFNNSEFGEIRTFKEPDGTVLFCGSDVARSLGYTNPQKAINDHCKGVTKRSVGVKTGLRLDGTPALQNVSMNFIPKGDVIRLAASSKLPGAEKFESWIFDVVIPTVLDHGVYATAATAEKLINDPEFLIQTFTALKEEREQRHALESKVEADKPKVLFADAVAASDSPMLIGELAKVLKQNGVDIGEKRLFKWMRTHGYLIRRSGSDYNAPTQRSMELGLFKVKETCITHADGHVTVNRTTKVTGKGQQYFIDKFIGKYPETKKAATRRQSE